MQKTEDFSSCTVGFPDPAEKHTVVSPMFVHHCTWSAGHPELCLCRITGAQWHWPWNHWPCNHWPCWTCLIALPCVSVSCSDCATFAI